jgi:hypothetical protein
MGGKEITQILTMSYEDIKWRSEETACQSANIAIRRQVQSAFGNKYRSLQNSRTTMQLKDFASMVRASH